MVTMGIAPIKVHYYYCMSGFGLMSHSVAVWLRLDEPLSKRPESVCLCECVSNLTSFKLQCIRQFVSYHIQALRNGRLMDALFAHARFEDLDLEARSQWVGKR